jgi:Plasmid pRiA4b ORF-3-like protein
VTIFRVKATLKDIKPPIWRRIELSGATTLKQFHRILQIAFGWQECHLHEFIAGKLRFGVPDDDDFGKQVIPEGKVRLSEVLSAPGQKLKYLYDFGDDWRHEILLEAVLAPDDAAQYPRVADGARCGPPEDCGGSYGYADLLEILSDEAHERFEEMHEWAGPGFNAEEFSREAINSRLKRNRSLAVKAER